MFTELNTEACNGETRLDQTTKGTEAKEELGLEVLYATANHLIS